MTPKIPPVPTWLMVTATVLNLAALAVDVTRGSVAWAIVNALVAGFLVCAVVLRLTARKD